MSLLLKPAEDRRVRHPDGRLIASEGERVPATPHYLRLRRAGDLVPPPKLQSRPKPRKSTRSQGSKTA